MPRPISCWRDDQRRDGRGGRGPHPPPSHWKAQPPMRADGHVLTFIMDRVPTPIGDMLVVVDRDGNLRAADFFDHEERMRTLLLQQYAREGSVAIIEGAVPKAIRSAI